MEILAWVGPCKSWPLIKSDEGRFILNLADPSCIFYQEDLEIELSHAQLFKHTTAPGISRFYYRTPTLFIVITKKRTWFGLSRFEAMAYPMRIIIGLNPDCRDCLSCTNPGAECHQPIRRKSLQHAI